MIIPLRHLSRVMNTMEGGRIPRVITVLTGFKDLRQDLMELIPNVEFKELHPDERAEDLKSLKESEIILADANKIAPYLYELEKTKWIQGTWAGVDAYLQHIDVSKPKPKFTITRFSGSIAFGCQMAEFIISQIVMRERNFKKVLENQTKNLWSREANIWRFRILADLKIGILGFGVIGKEVARIMKAFHVNVWVLVTKIPSEDSRSPNVDEYRTVGELPELLSACDYVCNVLPSTDETRGLLGNGMLANCATQAGGKGAVFVNVGRGSIITESDLLEALDKKWISGAILDVFEEEPLPAESRLWSMPQVAVTPHVSGVSRTKDVAELFAKNLALYSSGQPLPFVFDLDKGY